MQVSGAQGICKGSLQGLCQKAGELKASEFAGSQRPVLEADEPALKTNRSRQRQKQRAELLQKEQQSSWAKARGAAQPENSQSPSKEMQWELSFRGKSAELLSCSPFVRLLQQASFSGLPHPESCLLNLVGHSPLRLTVRQLVTMRIISNYFKKLYYNKLENLEKNEQI